ncbi:MAG TPA: hypothetical protein VG843_00980 [Rhizomicrobium sp.]|jgi:hypothetical protein|nr:hypothetical protein [Rhizomicrobium sp.]
MMKALKNLIGKLGGKGCGCNTNCRCGDTCRCKSGETCGAACNCAN